MDSTSVIFKKSVLYKGEEEESVAAMLKLKKRDYS